MADARTVSLKTSRSHREKSPARTWRATCDVDSAANASTSSCKEPAVGPREPSTGTNRNACAADTGTSRYLCRWRTCSVCRGARRKLADHQAVGDGLQGRRAPGNGVADLAGRQQFVVVLGIADGDGIVGRQPQRAQCFAQPGRLADRKRQQHQPAAVEVQAQRQLHRLHDVEGDARVRGIELDHAAAGAHRQPARAQRGQQRLARGRGELPRMPRCRQGQHGAALGDHRIEQPQVADQGAQIGDDPAGDQHDDDALRAHEFDRCAHVGMQRAIAGDRAVVVQCQDPQSHEDIRQQGLRSPGHGNRTARAESVRTRRRYFASGNRTASTTWTMPLEARIEVITLAPLTDILPSAIRIVVWLPFAIASC